MAFPVTSRALFLVLCACLQVLLLNAFNLEPRLPIIKVGSEGSYFGYSVAEHQIVDTDNVRRPIENVLLIGAPKYKTVAYNYSGAVFRCPWSTEETDCEEINIEGSDDHGDETILRNGQWLGVTVSSQGPGGYVMACAHRFVIAGPDFQWGRGICYSLEQDLDLDTRRIWEPCSNQPVNKAHEQYGYCQVGTSGEITEDNTIVIGTPGPFTWRGTVYTNNVRFKFGDDKKWYSSPHQEENSPVDKYSYLGMAVTSGKFFGTHMSYVAGAPRSNGTGQVVFFQKKAGDTTFLVEMILDGYQFASSFGYTLTSLDTNKDGYLDLVVGAPFYYDKGQGGAVYIYMNLQRGINKYSDPIKMTGKLESRFGFALENAGDLNQDGYFDLAVGAPYEEGGGAVYIYSGSDDGLIMTPSQVILAKDIPRTVDLKTFGYSLDGGVDIDGNGYPDLMVGCYESNTAILLRSRPVLDIITSVTGDLTKIDPDKIGCEKDVNATAVCFSFDACFKFNATFTSLASSVQLQYKIEAETFTGRKYYRVRFKSALDQNSPNIVIKEIPLRGSSLTRRHCREEIVYLKDKSDIQNPIRFKLSFSLMRKDPILPPPGSDVPNIDSYPILNQQEASRIFEAKFLKDCANDTCESDLHVVADINLPKNDLGEPILYLGEKQVALSIKVTNSLEPAYDAMLYVKHPSSLSYVGRKVVKGDQIECFPFNNTPVVSCELGNPLKKTDVEFQVKFNPKNVSDTEKTLRLVVKANTTSNEISHENDISIEIGIVKVAELEIRGGSPSEQVFYGGEAFSVPVYEEDIGNEVIHIYEIINHGPWLASSLEVVISWPYEKADTYDHGKWLLYITENPEVIGNGYCDLKPSQRNPLKLQKRPQALTRSPEVEPSRQRQKRDVAPQELRTGDKSKIVTLDCESQTARCFQFSCFFKNLERGATALVKIKARLWNSTFVEDYPSVDYVSIISGARIRILPDDISQNADNDLAFAETKAFPDIRLYQKPEEVPLWIIILSACIGVLLLILLIVILWKCGFFKRKKPGYEPAPTTDKDFM